MELVSIVECNYVKYKVYVLLFNFNCIVKANCLHAKQDCEALYNSNNNNDNNNNNKNDYFYSALTWPKIYYKGD